MRALDLDFAPQDAKRKPVGNLLLLFAIACCCITISHYQKFKTILTATQADVARMAHVRPQPKAVALPASEFTPAQLRQLAIESNRTIHALSQPWDRLFAVLELAPDPHVALQSVQSDRANRTLTLMGGAENADALLNYQRQLKKSPMVADAFLENQTLKADGAKKMIQFTILITWRGQS